MIIERIRTEDWLGTPRWLIATNTKCGSMSLEASLENDAVIMLPRHDMDVATRAPYRLMTRRNPLHRFISMFHYFQRQPFWQDKAVDWNTVTTLDGFVAEFRKRRDASLGQPYKCTNMFNWTNTLTENEALCQPTRTYDVTELQELLDHLAIVFSMPYRKLRHVNKSTKRYTAQPLTISKNNYDWLHDWAFEDNVRWNYKFFHGSVTVR